MLITGSYKRKFILKYGNSEKVITVPKSGFSMMVNIAAKLMSFYKKDE